MNKVDMTAIDPGGLVRRVRQRRGLTQRQLAIRAGTDQSTISRIERGVEGVTVGRLEQLLLSMGERLVLDAEPLVWDGDRDDLRAERRLSPERRLADGLRFVEGASQLYESGLAARRADGQ